MFDDLHVLDLLDLTDEEKKAPIVGKVYAINVGWKQQLWKSFRVIDRAIESGWYLVDSTNNDDLEPDEGRYTSVSWDIWVSRNDVMNMPDNSWLCEVAA